MAFVEDEAKTEADSSVPHTNDDKLVHAERQSLSQRLQPWLKWVSLVARLGLAAVWLVSGYYKFIEPAQTELAVGAYQILPTSLVPIVALTLPLAEIALGFLLLLGVFTRWVAVFSVLLMLLFMAGIASAWARGLSLDCGCFGGGGYDSTVTASTYVRELLRDTGFVLLGIWLVWRPRSPLAVEPSSRG